MSKNSKSIALILTLMFVTICVNAQKVVNNKFNNEYTELIAGKVSLIAPNNFEKSSKFNGLEQKYSGSSIVITDLPVAYNTFIKGFTVEELSKTGLSIRKRDTYMINDRSAVLITAEQKAHGNTYLKLSLALEGENETILINGACPVEEVSLGAAIRVSILSVIYDDKKAKKASSLVDFGVDTKASKLKETPSISGSLVYNVAGVIPNKHKDQTTLVITKSDWIEGADAKEYSEERLLKSQLSVSEFISVNKISIDGLDGYAILADGKSLVGKKPIKVYQITLFSDTNCYVLLGSTNINFDANLAELKKVAATFKRK